MQEEFSKSYKTIQKVLFEPHKNGTPWRSLFQPQLFFEEAKGWYVQVSTRESTVLFSYFMSGAKLVLLLAPGVPGTALDPVVRHSRLTQIEVVAGDADQLKTWDGWVRSRLKLMVKNMEEHVNARPLPTALEPPKEVPSSAAAAAAAEGGVDDIKGGGDQVAASPAVPRRHSKFYFLCVTKRSPQV